MKKKILFTITVCFIVGIAVVNTKIQHSERGMSISFREISVMALADGESSGSTCDINCPNPGNGCIITFDNGTMLTCPDRHT